MCKETLPIIVSAGGKLQIDVCPEMTKKDLFAVVEERWGLRVDQTVDPFVVIHDTVLNKHQILEDGKVLDVVPEDGREDGRYVLRIVLPLKEEQDD